MIDTFFIIKMNTRNNKNLYLVCDKGNSMRWSFNKNEACWFNTFYDARKFAERYFKTFEDWHIEDINYNLYELKEEKI